MQPWIRDESMHGESPITLTVDDLENINVKCMIQQQMSNSCPSMILMMWSPTDPNSYRLPP